MLILFHCESNPGFAASSHEHTFLRVAEELVGRRDHIHFAYSTLAGGMTPSMPADLTNVIELDTRWAEAEHGRRIESYVRQHRISLLLGFDQPPRRPLYRALRKGGVQHFVSYQGAPMSSLQSGPKFWLKQLEMAFKGDGPDHYVFQSDDMRRTATHGRGIPARRTSVVRTGIDTDRFRPSPEDSNYVYEQFGIPRSQRIIFFSGHMEERKGVHVVIKAAVHLVSELGIDDVHFLILGNREGQEARFLPLLENTRAAEHVTFGGYRSDVAMLLRGCSIGMIASTGWDSFPMSSLEMAASGLPLLVSELPGLRECVTRETGVTFPVGDHVAAAEILRKLLENPEGRLQMGAAGRSRVLRGFSRELQVQGLATVFRTLMGRR
jgi:glycosyltransferase involved in cell wall biosynthesis